MLTCQVCCDLLLFVKEFMYKGYKICMLDWLWIKVKCLLVHACMVHLIICMISISIFYDFYFRYSNVFSVMMILVFIRFADLELFGPCWYWNLLAWLTDLKKWDLSCFLLLLFVCQSSRLFEFAQIRTQKKDKQTIFQKYNV